jgi:hypothetical protein
MGPNAIDEIRAGQIELIFGDCFRPVIEQRPRVLAQKLFNPVKAGGCSFQFGGHYFCPPGWAGWFQRVKIFSETRRL